MSEKWIQLGSWNTRKSSLCLIAKNSSQHHICLVYRECLCACGADYIVETIRNFKTRWNECNTGKDKMSDSVKP